MRNHVKHKMYSSITLDGQCTDRLHKNRILLQSLLMFTMIKGTEVAGVFRVCEIEGESRFLSLL